MEKITLLSGSELVFDKHITLVDKNNNKTNLGFITGDTYFKNEKESGKLKRPTLAWTVLMEIYEKVNRVVYVTDKYTYTFDKPAHDNPIIRTYQGERKIVIPIKNFKVEDNVKEASTSSQG